MVLRNLESPHGLKKGILKYEYAKEEGDKGLEGGPKSHNNLVVNVGIRGSMYVNLFQLKPNLVLGEDVKMNQIVEASGKCARVNVPRFHTLVKDWLVFRLKVK